MPTTDFKKFNCWVVFVGEGSQIEKTLIYEIKFNLLKPIVECNYIKENCYRIPVNVKGIMLTFSVRDLAIYKIVT